MDGLKIRMHPTLDILCREDGAVIKAFGVRACDDKKAWNRAYSKAKRECLKRGDKWVAPRVRK